MKKKIFLLLTFIFASVLALTNIEPKKVNAECTEHINYYLFLDATNYNFYKSEIEKVSPYVYVTQKAFPLEAPNEEDIIEHGPVIIEKGSNTVTDTRWGSNHYFEVLTSTPSDGIKEDGNYSYTRAVKWQYLISCQDGNCNFSEIQTSSTPLDGYTVDEFNKSSAYPETAFDFFNNDGSLRREYVISRSFTLDDLPNESDVKEQTLTINGTETTSKTVWSPAVYYIKYKKCENIPTTPVETTSKLTVEHLDEETSEKIDIDYTKDGYKNGDDYTYQCKKVPGYTVTNTTDHPSIVKGTFEDADITRQCYYTKNDYTLTINYGEDEDCTTNLKDPETYTLKYKETRTFQIDKEINKMTNPRLGTYSAQFITKPTLDGTNLQVTMPAKNVSVCIVYQAQTGSTYIYIAWIIGLLALGYSIWYFVRYYKKQNNEI